MVDLKTHESDSGKVMTRLTGVNASSSTECLLRGRADQIGSKRNQIWNHDTSSIQTRSIQNLLGLHRSTYIRPSQDKLITDYYYYL